MAPLPAPRAAAAPTGATLAALLGDIAERLIDVAELLANRPDY